MKKINRHKPVKALFQKGSSCRIRYSSNILLQELGEMTNYKCAYCERHKNTHTEKIPQIEHFRPQSKFPNLKDVWINLFWSCPTCNSMKYKGNKFEKELENGKNIRPLKPDQNGIRSKIDYHFKDWFRIDFDTGILIPLKRNKEWQRAKWTIELFGLNRDELKTARKSILEKYKKDFLTQKIDLDKWSFSFYIL